MADRQAEESHSGPGLLLDRDGTLIEERHFLSRPDQIVLMDGAVEALRRIRQAGFRIVILTNQSGVARGYFSREQLEEVHRSLFDRLAQDGVELDGILYCPHHPEGCVPPYAAPCRCRKPAPGMVEEALDLFDLDPRATFIVGDSPRDLVCAAAWPIRRVLVLTGYGQTASKTPELAVCPPHHITVNLAEATRWILDQPLCEAGQPDGTIQQQRWLT